MTVVPGRYHRRDSARKLYNVDSSVDSVSCITGNRGTACFPAVCTGMRQEPDCLFLNTCGPVKHGREQKGKEDPDRLFLNGTAPEYTYLPKHAGS
jgi:ribosomal protein L27